MKRYPYVVRTLSILVSLVLTSSAAGQISSSVSIEGVRASSPRVLPPVAHPFSQSYGEWAAAWWQWTFSLPEDTHPLADTADCDAGPTGPVWFLGGTFTTVESSPSVVVGEADRSCAVPSGKAIFFPIINGECNDALTPGTEEELRECANLLADHIQDLQVTVDGDPVDHLGLFRVETSLFSIGPLPDNNLLMAPAGSSGQAVSDGFYIMLAPLPAGTHDLHFSGRVVFTAAEDGFDFTFDLDIAYELTIGNANRR